jgi:MscS family membrane protein
MDFSERFNKKVLKLFNEEQIDFAFPTQTLYMAGDSRRPLILGVSSKDEAT